MSFARFFCCCAKNELDQEGFVELSGGEYDLSIELEKNVVELQMRVKSMSKADNLARKGDILNVCGQGTSFKDLTKKIEDQLHNMKIKFDADSNVQPALAAVESIEASFNKPRREEGDYHNIALQAHRLCDELGYKLEKTASPLRAPSL